MLAAFLESIFFQKWNLHLHSARTTLIWCNLYFRNSFFNFKNIFHSLSLSRKIVGTVKIIFFLLKKKFEFLLPKCPVEEKRNFFVWLKILTLKKKTHTEKSSDRWKEKNRGWGRFRVYCVFVMSMTLTDMRRGYSDTWRRIVAFIIATERFLFFLPFLLSPTIPLPPVYFFYYF